MRFVGRCFFSRPDLFLTPTHATNRRGKAPGTLPCFFLALCFLRVCLSQSRSCLATCSLECALHSSLSLSLPPYPTHCRIGPFFIFKHPLLHHHPSSLCFSPAFLPSFHFLVFHSYSFRCCLSLGHSSSSSHPCYILTHTHITSCPHPYSNQSEWIKAILHRYALVSPCDLGPSLPRRV